MPKSSSTQFWHYLSVRTEGATRAAAVLDAEDRVYDWSQRLELITPYAEMGDPSHDRAVRI